MWTEVWTIDSQGTVWMRTHSDMHFSCETPVRADRHTSFRLISTTATIPHGSLSSPSVLIVVPTPILTPSDSISEARGWTSIISSSWDNDCRNKRLTAILRNHQPDLCDILGSLLIYVRVEIVEIEIHINHALRYQHPSALTRKLSRHGHTTSLPVSEPDSSSSSSSWGTVFRFDALAAGIAWSWGFDPGILCIELLVYLEGKITSRWNILTFLIM
jgi:hypothetical protein